MVLRDLFPLYDGVILNYFHKKIVKNNTVFSILFILLLV